MAEDLPAALAKVHIGAKAAADLKDDWINDILNEQRPRKRSKVSKDDLKQQIECDFLTPTTTFSHAWLNRLQQ